MQLESHNLRGDLQTAAVVGIVTPAQADSLRTFLREHSLNLFGDQSGFRATHIFYYVGCIGVAMYLGHHAYDLFKDSLLFPFVLTFIGLAVIGLGIKWQKL